MIYSPGPTSYGLDDLEPTVRQTTKMLRPHLDKFDSIVVTGMSGVLVGAPVSLRLRKPLIVVRKKSDDAHHVSTRRIINLHRLGTRSLFLDDFGSSGDTEQYVRARVSEDRGQIVGRYFYQWDEMRWDTEKVAARYAAAVADTDIPF